MALGGGLDVCVSERVALRVFQIDYNPVFLRVHSLPERKPLAPEGSTRRGWRVDVEKAQICHALWSAPHRPEGQPRLIMTAYT